MRTLLRRLRALVLFRRQKPIPDVLGVASGKAHYVRLVLLPDPGRSYLLPAQIGQDVGHGHADAGGRIVGQVGQEQDHLRLHGLQGRIPCEQLHRHRFEIDLLPSVHRLLSPSHEGC